MPEIKTLFWHYFNNEKIKPLLNYLRFTNTFHPLEYRIETEHRASIRGIAHILIATRNGL